VPDSAVLVESPIGRGGARISDESPKLQESDVTELANLFLRE